MRLILVALFTALIVILAPGSANAACIVPQERAFYETPELQVRVSHGRMLACLRGSDTATPVGHWRRRSTDSYEETSVLHSWDNWLWTLDDTADAASPPTRMVLTDVATKRQVSVRTYSVYPPSFQAAAVPGALVVTGEDGVLALRSDGRVQPRTGAHAA